MRNKFALFIMLFILVSASQVRLLQHTSTQVLEDPIQRSTLSIDEAYSPGFIESSIYSNVTLGGGSTHTCSIASNETVLCWGRNNAGQLGTGDYDDTLYPTPIDIPEGTKVSSISVGLSHNCMILSNSEVFCWGANDHGQLGLGYAGNDENSPIAIMQSFQQNYQPKFISVGLRFTCAIVNDGSVYCWGEGYQGKLGNGDESDSLTPTSVLGLPVGKEVIGLSAYTNFACALIEDGSVYCWGNNGNGELGLTPLQPQYSSNATAVDLGQNRTALAISSGAHHTCAILDNGNISCWGAYTQGELGRNDSSPYPAQIELLNNTKRAISISAGDGHTCAILQDKTYPNSSFGDVYCWGRNDWGQLGHGTPDSGYEPRKVPLGDNISAIAITTGLYHSCAILSNKSTICWGMNMYSQFGDGTTTGSSTPVHVTALFDNVLISERDFDNDNVLNIFDEFPRDEYEWVDSDGDGVGDNSDPFPIDPNEWLDSDGDGVGDNGDSYPNDSNEWKDSDGDGIGDNGDQFPNNPNEWSDSDNDGVGDNSDLYPHNSSEWADSDGDGVGDNSDLFPNDYNEWADSDGDGVGDNSDVFPFDLYESLDSDNDGIGDNADVFPNDPNESFDSDSDGVGDNSDYCPGTLNMGDTDSNGCGKYQIEIDDDDDGVFNYLDECPNSPPSQYVNEAGCVPVLSSEFSNESNFESRKDATQKVAIIDSGDYESDLLLTEIDDEVLIWIEDISGFNDSRNNPVDIYLVTLDQLGDHFCGGEDNMFASEFTPLYSLENLYPSQLPVQISYTPTSDDSLWLIIDNCDNQRYTDWGTNSTGNFSQIEVTYSIDDNSDEVGEAVAKGILTILGGGLLLFCGIPILLAIIIIVLLLRNRKSTKKLQKQIENTVLKTESREQFESDKMKVDSTENQSKQGILSAAGPSGPPEEKVTQKSSPSRPRPSQSAKGVIGEDGYEWITFPPNSQNHFYRASIEEEWLTWDE